MAELLKWDQTGERFYETGVKKVVLYPLTSGAYSEGVAWNGVTNITEKPSGAEPTALYADDIKYLNLMSVEEFGASLEAYTYPDEFAACDGSGSLVDGVSIGQQTRQTFGLCYRTTVGNDESPEKGYKLHLVYGLVASPSEKSYATINDSPEAATFSWELTSTPVEVAGFRPTSIITIDSLTVGATGMAAIEAVLYGAEAAAEGGTPTEARLPLPNEVKTIIEGAE